MDPVRLRIITPITTSDFRDTTFLATLSCESAELSSVYLRQGPVSVESALDEMIAAPGIVERALEAEEEGWQAVVVDCMLDPALSAAREAVDIKVIGCGESSMRAASNLGRFAIVTVLDRQKHAFEQLAGSYELLDSLTSVKAINVPVLELEKNKEQTLKATTQACQQVVQEEGVAAIVFGCTGMLGLGTLVQVTLSEKGLDVQIFDPLPFAVKQAILAVQQQQNTNRAEHPLPDRKAILSFEDWPRLRARLGPTKI